MSLRSGAHPRMETLCLLFAVMTLPGHAQVGQNGSISGSITAIDRAAIGEGNATLSGPDGSTRTAAVSPDGSFSLRDLPSGTYTVRASAPGFGSVTQSQVTVAVGRATQLRFVLPVAGERETVNVTASQTAFDPSQTSSVVNIDRDRIEELPIPSRNYLSFVLLSPQVAPANPALTEGTLTQSAGGFSFGGLRPGSNAVSVDGVEDDDEYTGGSRTQLSPEAISDFQVVNHGFAAESGGAAGGSIDVQTRSGLNKAHGDAFVFIQNGALNGSPPLESTARKPAESRLRAGTSIGRAIRPDKTFFYAAAEQEIARGEDANDLGVATIARINDALRGVGPMRGTILQPGLFSTTDQETEVSGRLDHVLTGHQSGMLRYAFTNSRNVNDAFNTDEITDRSARGSSFILDNSVNGTLTSALESSLVNKASFEVSQRRAVERTQMASAPGVSIPGVALFGTPFLGNSRRFETHLEAEDQVLLERGHHLIQIGGGLNHVDLRVKAEDGFRGLFVFSDINALATGNADFFTQIFGDATTSFAENRINAYAQDHWTPCTHLALDLGVRYETNRLPPPLPQNGVNFSPRIGVAWTPRSSLVVRGGFGIFYDRFQLATIRRVLNFDGVRGFQQTVEGAAAASVYRSGVTPMQPLAGVAPSIWQARNQISNAYSEVASLSGEQALPSATSLTAEYQYVRGVKLGRSSNSNLTPPVLLTRQSAASLGLQPPTLQQTGRPFFSADRQSSAFDAINEFASSAGSKYSGATVTLNRQFQEDLQLLAGYTFSKTVDDASFDLEQPQDPFAPQAERSPSLQDQRHRFTLSGLWLIGPDAGDPADAARNSNPGPLMRLLTGLEFAPILSVTSGFRANPVTGLDSNREHIYPFAARPSTYARNSLTTSPRIDLDFRVLRIVPLGRGHLDVVAESFNLLNHRNVLLLDTVFGSDGVAREGFGGPLKTSAARRIQFSLDYEF